MIRVIRLAYYDGETDALDNITTIALLENDDASDQSFDNQKREFCRIKRINRDQLGECVDDFISYLTKNGWSLNKNFREDTF